MISSDNWRVEFERQYVLICKHCSRKVIDPDKNPNQIFSKNICPHCGLSKSDKPNKCKIQC